MADPGSIVGVVALALQVFQGLSAYYSHFKAHDDDIVNSLRRIERVQGTLSALEGPLKSLELDNDVISEQVRLSIVACVEALSQLEEMAKKCKSQTAPDNLHEKIRQIRDRALFPLRKGTLEDLARCLDRFQGNLDTVIQALELDVLIRIDERGQRQSAALMYQTRTIRRHQGYQTELLEFIQDSSVQGLNSMSNISDQLQDMQKKLALLAPFTSEWQNGLTLAPSVLREGIESYSEVISTSRKIASKARRQCRCPRIDSPRAHGRGFLSVFWQKQNSHDKTCPLHQKNHQIGFLGARLEFCRQFIVHVVEFQVTCSRGAGGSTIASTLRYRNWIRGQPHHAIYHLFDHAFFSIRERRHEIRDIFTSLKKDILKCFDSGIASPTDMFVDGITYIHHFCMILGVYKRKFDARDILDFLSFLIDVGVPVEQEAWSPLNMLLRVDYIDRKSGIESISSYMIDQGFSFRCVPSHIEENTWNYHLPEMITFGNIAETYDDDPCISAILHRSSSELLDILGKEYKAPPHDVIPSYFNSVYDWPEGLWILCSKFSGWLSSGSHTERVWTAFVQRHDIESLRTLLASGLRLRNNMWSSSVISGFSECIKLVLDTIASDCKKPPANRKHCTRGFDPNLLFHCAYLDCHTAEKVFAANIQDLSIETKVKIEDIDTGGFIEPTSHGKFYSDPNGGSRVAYAEEYTPIFRHALELLSGYDFDHILSTMKLLEWFVGKGAQYSWIEPWTSTTPAHLIGSCLLCLLSAKYKAIRYIVDGPKISLEKLTSFLLDKDYSAPFYLRTVSMDHTDNCNCACSQSGCIPILGAVKVALWPFDPKQPTISQEVLYKSLQVIEEPLSRSLARRIAVTRTITFERLGIRHTCHDVFIREDGDWRPGIYDYYHFVGENCDERISRRQEETSEFHGEDSELINRLEDLMLEFEAKLADHTGTFVEFFSGYWTTRMNEVDEELSIVTKEHKQAIREAGVVICPTFGPELPPDWEERNRVTEVE